VPTPFANHAATYNSSFEIVVDLSQVGER
jgi:hypothetical protein